MHSRKSEELSSRECERLCGPCYLRYIEHAYAGLSRQGCRSISYVLLIHARCDPALETDLVDTMAYCYRPLAERHIRTLRPTISSTCEISCTLHEFELEPAVFIAASHVWGATTKKRTITLEGHQFSVTENALDVLKIFAKRARSQFDIEYLWIDAICIDQGNARVKQQ